MTSWCKHVAVAIAWLTLTAAAGAQPGYPNPVGAARIPEPIRFTPDGQPPPVLVPGPVNPIMAPVGPPSTLSLPADSRGAFDVNFFPPETAGFFTFGGLALKRSDLNNAPIVYTDNQSGGLDTGVVPLGELPPALRLDNIDMQNHGGFKGTVGFLFGSEAVELTGFYVPSQSNSATVINQGRLLVPFAYNTSFPEGFEGNGGLWRQADLVRAQFTNTLGNAELNYRVWNSGLNQFELIMGLRYFYTDEEMSLFTDDEFFVRDIFNQPDPNRQATYQVSTRNNIFCAQMGGEMSIPMPIPIRELSWIWFTGMVKTAWGPNFIQRKIRLTRGDEFQGIKSDTSGLRFGSVYEAAGYIDLRIFERMRIRGGYMAVLATGVSSGSKQIEWDFERQGQRPLEFGSIFWHGPVLEMLLLF